MLEIDSIHSARTLKERFWSKVQKTDGCWLWLAAVDRKGYGRFSIEDNKPRFAHRVSYALTYGECPDNLNVCHCCDNPRCVRPDHLFLGTQSDNMRDCVAKGRLWAIGGKLAVLGRKTLNEHPELLRRGSKHPLSKLTEDVVRQIRSDVAKGESLGSVARRLNITKSTVCGIVKRRSWKHV